MMRSPFSSPVVVLALFEAIAGSVVGQVLPEFARARLGSYRFRHPVTVTSIAFSPDAKEVATGAADGILRLWSVKTGQVNRAYNEHKEEVRRVLFTPDGQRLLSASLDCTIRIWKVGSTKSEMVIEAHSDGVEDMDLSPDGHFLASGGRDHEVNLWNAPSGEKARTLKGHESGVVRVVFSPDGAILATGSRDKTVRLWDVSTGKSLAVLRGHKDYVDAIAFSPNGRILASSGRDETIRLWDVGSGKTLADFEAKSRVWSLCFTPKGKYLIVGGDGIGRGKSARQSTLVLWDWKKEKVHQVLSGHSEDPLRRDVSEFRTPFRGTAGAVLSPAGDLMASCGADGLARLHNLATGKRLFPDEGHQGAIAGVAFTADGRRIVTASSDGTVRIWDAQTGKEVREIMAHPGGVNGLSLSGRSIVTGGQDGVVREWSKASGKKLREWQDSPEPIQAIALSQNEQLLAIAQGQPGGEDRIAIRDWKTGKVLWTTNGYRYPIRSLQFAPDQKSLAVVTVDHELHHIDLENRRELSRRKGQLYDVASVSHSSDGRYIAAGFWGSRSLAIWTRAGRVLVDVRATSHKSRATLFSPSGHTVATGSEDGIVRLWDGRTGNIRRTFQGHLDQVTALAFSPDGQWLASASADQTVVIWNVLSPRKALPAAPGPAAMNVLWQSLLADRGEVVHEAICQMASRPKAAILCLQGHLKPIPPLTKGRIQGLIRHLDARLFRDRERAMAELANLGRLVEEPLRMALGKAKSLEHRRRLRALLERIKKEGALSEWQRTDRAIEILELIGSKDAIALLGKLAKGGEAPPTERAREALKRIQSKGSK